MSDRQTPLPVDASLTFAVGQCSRAGVKPVNEDAIGIRIPEGELLATKGVVAVIADGVSAAEAGREASETCVRNFLSDYYSTPEVWSVKKSARQVLTSLNRWLYGQSLRFADEHKGFVCTLSIAIFKSQSVHLFHVGDTRVYRYRGGELQQLTRDHALPVSESQSYLTRAMGLDVHLDVDYQRHELELGDIFFLSTDGVHDKLSSGDIGSALGRHPDDWEQVAEGLIDAALENGSTDNLSAQILRVERLPALQVDDVVSRLTSLPFPPFLQAGMVLDGYRIERELHASSRSQLYLVRDVESGTAYCMKTPSVNFEDDPAYIERFVLESWIGSRVNSPHVVAVIDSPRRKSCLYYLMEYVEGISLAEWIVQNPKPAVQDVVYLVDQVSRGLQALHRRETLHQDIKPDNILLDRLGCVKIVDFGSCHAAGVAEIATPIAREIALGTASYSAPEYQVKQKPGPPADIFSLAVLTFEMLTGELPFGGQLEHCKTPNEFLKTRYVAAYQINPLVPVWIDGALRKSLRYHPERRHQEVSELIFELQKPNSKYLDRDFQPLLERNPVLLWKLVAGCLGVTQLLSLYFLFRS